MSQAIIGFLKMQGIELLQGDVWGHRKDIDEYFEVPDEAINAIHSLKEKGATPEETAKEVQKIAKLGEDLVSYFVRTAATA